MAEELSIVDAVRALEARASAVEIALKVTISALWGAHPDVLKTVRESAMGGFDQVAALPDITNHDHLAQVREEVLSMFTEPEASN